MLCENAETIAACLFMRKSEKKLKIYQLPERLAKKENEI